MIFEGPPYESAHSKVFAMEYFEYYKSPHDAARLKVQATCVIRRSGWEKFRVFLKIRVYPAGLMFVPVLEGFVKPESFWDENTEFAELPLKMGKVIDADKRKPAILLSHYSNVSYVSVADFFVGKYEHMWYVAPGLGKSSAPETLDPLDMVILDKKQEEHIWRNPILGGENSWISQNDPWHRITSYANLFMLRVAASDSKRIGDFWVYCPNPAGETIESSVLSALKLIETQGLDVKFVSNPVPMERFEDMFNGLWGVMEHVNSAQRLKELLRAFEYVSD